MSRVAFSGNNSRRVDQNVNGTTEAHLHETCIATDFAAVVRLFRLRQLLAQLISAHLQRLLWRIAFAAHFEEAFLLYNASMSIVR